MLPYNAMRLRQYVAPVPIDIIQLLGEGANGGTVWTDGGSAGSVWTHGGSAIETSTADFQQGAASLHSTSAGAKISTPLVSANAITTGDFFIGAWVKVVSGANSRYLLGNSDNLGTAAGTAWFVYSASALQAYLFISDGSTVHNVTFGTWSGAWQYLRIERVSNTIYCSLGTAAPRTYRIREPTTPTCA
jgi:hypothetical protein